MISSVSYHGANLRYSDLGKGDPVVLIHGYLESLEIWDGFAEKLARKLRLNDVPILGYIENDIFHLNLLTVTEGDSDIIVEALNQLL